MQPKFAFTVNTPDTRAKALAWSGDPGEIFAKLRVMGYEGVELFVRDPKELDPAKYRRLLTENALEAAAVGTGQILAEDKLFFTHDDPAIRQAAAGRVSAAIDFAADIGCKVVNVGKIRGNHGGCPEKKKWMEEGFRIIEARARAKNVMITLEPQNRFGCDNCTTTESALAWLRAVNLPNLKLMLDVFHMQIEDPSIPAGFIEAGDMLMHVHFADTNRAAPGSGGIDFAQTLRILKALRYDRFITMEIAQNPDSETAARHAVEYCAALRAAIWRSAPRST